MCIQCVFDDKKKAVAPVHAIFYTILYTLIKFSCLTVNFKLYKILSSSLPILPLIELDINTAALTPDFLKHKPPLPTPYYKNVSSHPRGAAVRLL